MKQIATRLLIISILVIALITTHVSAQSSESFTHWDTANDKNVAVISRAMYQPIKRITGSSLGLDTALNGLTDIFCDSNGYVYVLCGESSRVFVLNEDYTLQKELIVKSADGETESFNGAKGIYVDESGTVYISDTNNGRILILDNDGLVTDILSLPESELIPDDFQFQPTALIKDSAGNICVLSQGSYYGAVLYSPKKEFLGFYGASTVQASALDVLSYLWDLITSTDVKKSKAIRVLPYAFNDLSLDNDGYIYTCTGSTEIKAYTNGVGHLRMLSPGGTNILLKRNLDGTSSSSSNINFLEEKVIVYSGKHRVQNFVSIAINKDGYIFALDKAYGLVYVYDTDCNLITAFGGGVEEGNQLGLFNTATALAIKGSQVLVIDSKLNSITVFDITPYGELVQQAQKMYLNGDYSEAEGLWRKVLSLDRNSRLAYRGIAKALYVNGYYKASLEYARNALDYVTYDLAYHQILKQFTAKYFILIFGLGVLGLSALAAFLIKIKNRQTVIIKNQKLRTFLSVPVHPFKSFADIKYKNQGSILIASVIIVLFFIITNIRLTAGGFLFSKLDVETFNSLYVLAQTVGLAFLWILANWAICTLFSGKGRINEITIATTYSLVPLLVFNILHTVLSHILSYEGEVFLNILYTVALIFTLFLLSIGIMTVHEFEFGKFLVTTVITILFMLLIVFILFMIVILLQQFGNFIYTLYMEVAYR